MERKIKIQDVAKEFELTKAEMRKVYGGGTPILPYPTRIGALPIPVPQPIRVGVMPLPIP